MIKNKILHRKYGRHFVIPYRVQCDESQEVIKLDRRYETQGKLLEVRTVYLEEIGSVMGVLYVTSEDLTVEGKITHRDDSMEGNSREVPEVTNRKRRRRI